MPYKEKGDVSKSISVLFVDDSVTMRKVAEITFATDNYSLSSLSKGGEVIDTVKKSHPDVVILDAEMPDVDGYETCKRLRQDGDTGGVPVLLLSGPSSPYDERRAREAGVSDHIDKPFETQAIFDKVDALASSAPQPGLAPPAAAAQKAPPAPPGKEPGARPKVGSKTVLGLGAMGYAPKQGAAAQKAPPSPPSPPKQAAKPAASARPGPIASPVAAKPAAKKPVGASPPPPPQERHVPQPRAKLPPRDEVEEFDGETIVEIAQPEMEASVHDKAANLSPEQIETVRALAREVIERVVWEVVPDLAETIIKEELSKLLRE